ncbi:tetratricopeptide repeat protein [Streptomyces sp. NBC_01261]|uniref:tetratricopeptide repeat protein n=1 Tax=Streptomyces sp. NBC_01261 TaxID=2903802 RepID=UPI002E329E81|nr:tetratricopeptide repeat protein [Streptomyces sp. NBC_01261]
MAQNGALAAGRIDIQQTILRSASASHPLTLAAPLGLRDPSLPLRGREALVDSLTRVHLTGLSDGRVHVLHGLNGCGKTAIALEAAHRAQQHLGERLSLWWLSARRPEPLEESLRALAGRLGLRGRQTHAHELVDVLWQTLNRSRTPWMMIVDGADDPAVLDGPGLFAAGTGWARPHTCPCGLVLVTTSDGTPSFWGAVSALHPVHPLSDDDASCILTDHAGPYVGTHSAARSLARRLGGLPLALKLAGAYLAEVNAMPRAFREPGAPDDFAALRRALDGPQADTLNPAQAIAGTWRLSLDLLHHRGSVYARPLLGLLSVFAEAPIPIALVHPATLAGHPDFQGIDGRVLWRTLKALSALHLIDMATDTPVHDPHTTAGSETPSALRVHPLIRDASRQMHYLALAVELLHRACDLQQAGLPEEPENWPTWHLLAPHSLFLIRQQEALSELPGALQTAVARGSENAARYLLARGLLRPARDEFSRLLKFHRHRHSHDNEDTLSVRHNLAGVLHELGELAQAESAYRQVERGYRILLGDRHSHTLTARHELGRVLHDLGRLDDAEVELTAVVALRRDTQGDEHAHTLTARHELARVLHDLGRLDDAHTEYQHVLAWRRTHMGEEHPRTLTARHNLACLVQDRGQLGEALAEYERIHRVRQRVLGPQHPQTLHTAYRLGCAMRDSGQMERAHSLLTAVQQAMADTLGPHHPHSQRVAAAVVSCTPPGQTSTGG